MAQKKLSSRFSLLPKLPKVKSEITPLSEITDEEKLLAREVWMQVENNYVVISKALFKELFKKHPEYKNFFKDLIDPNNEEEDSWVNPRFERHMIHVLLPTVGSIIRNVDRPEDITGQMIKLGKIHKLKDIGIKRKNVETLKNILVNTLKTFLGGGIRRDHEQALSKIFSSAFHTFEDALEGNVV